jgi:alpha-D-ribose 1-methylphosphonate 5-triphosphate synthase subunit PhnH
VVTHQQVFACNLREAAIPAVYQLQQQAIRGPNTLVQGTGQACDILCNLVAVVLQVLHYQEGEQYVEHWDYFHDAVNVKNGGQRVATALLYLSVVDEGAAEAG